MLLILKLGIFLFMIIGTVRSTPTFNPKNNDVTDQVTLTRDRRGSYTGSLNARAIEARGPSKDLNFNVNILTKLNSPFVFPLVISENENVMIWLLSRQTRESFARNSSETQSIALYDPRSLPRNQTYAKEFACLPSEDKCNRLSMPTVDVNDLGVYTFRFDTSNYLTVKTFSFNVSAYETAISMACENVTDKSKCSYNAETQTLSVVADEPVKLSCGIDILQNDNYPVSANFKFISENYGEECIAETTDLITSEYQPNNETFNVIRKTLKKSCERSFSISDISKSYSCELNPSMSSSDPTGQQTTKFESLDIKLDVQYGPDPTLSLNPISPNSIGLFNKTQMVGETTMKQKFVCPFMGNPKPTYYWRVVSVAINKSEQTEANSKLKTLTVTDEFLPSESQEFPIPSDLFIGSYSLECKAKVGGMIEKFSDTVSFNLKMIAPPTPPARNNNGSLNLGALIGGIFGGLALLILVVIVVIAVLRIRKNKAPKDEIEKAKDNKMGKNKQIGSLGGGNTVLSNVEEDDDDDGGFRVAEHSEAPNSQSYRSNHQNRGLTENSSLAQNKISDSKHSLSMSTPTTQLPILNIATLPSASQTTNNPVSAGNVTLSSTTMSNRVMNEKDKVKNLNDYTTSAHEFLTQSISQNALNHIDSSNGSTKNLNSPSTSFGVYSPSTAEARHLDASAPDSNLSYAARQAKMHLAAANGDEFTSGTQLGIHLKGGIKVLPTNHPLKLVNT